MSFESCIIKELFKSKKYEAVNEFKKISFPDKKEDIFVTEYAGTDIRLGKNKDGDILILYPKNKNDVSFVQESALAEAITSGKIFDDADACDNSAKYIVLTTLPCSGMLNKGIKQPEALRSCMSCAIGKMNDDGCFTPDDDVELRNGFNLMKDATQTNSKLDMINTVNNYLSNANNESHGHNGMKLSSDIAAVYDEIEAIKDITPEDSLSDNDWEELDFDEPDNDGYVEESFLSKKPKKLKPIPIRDITSYITVELNAIRDSNDQAMLSGYTCAKLELVDFYLTVIDTQDARYIVPHTKDYLLTGQKQLNALLTQILKIKPINKNDRVWQINVNYPEGWRG